MPRSRAAAPGRPTARFCLCDQLSLVCCLSSVGIRRRVNRCHKSSRPDRTIIERRVHASSGRKKLLHRLRERDAAGPRGPRGSPGLHRDEAAARCGIPASCYIHDSVRHPLVPSHVARCSWPTRLLLEGDAFRVVGQRLGRSWDQPCLALRVSVRTDCVRHGQDPSNAVHLVRSCWPPARDRWHTGSKRPGQSFAVARRQSDRFQPRRRWELGRVSDRHARRCQQGHVGARPRLQSQSGHRTAGRFSTNRTIQPSTHDR